MKRHEFFLLLYTMFGLATLGAYLTSLFYCIKEAEWMAVPVLHIFLAPVGVLHGFFLWFGAGWF